jgi:hypothetical protein
LPSGSVKMANRPEHLAVELLRALMIGADHLEERHWLTHRPLSVLKF